VKSLAQVLADFREEAQVLRRNRAAMSPDRCDEHADAIARAAEDYLRMISEGDARIRSGWSVPRLRALFPYLFAEGNAEWRGRTRYYRLVCIPPRPDLQAAREAGRQAAQDPTPEARAS
jgi:hypothetical protein